jgi:hypothetical protein
MDLHKSHQGGKCEHRMTNCGHVKSIRVTNFIQNTDFIKNVLFRTQPIYLWSFKNSLKVNLDLFTKLHKRYDSVDINIYSYPSGMMFILSEASKTCLKAHEEKGPLVQASPLGLSQFCHLGARLQLPPQSSRDLFPIFVATSGLSLHPDLLSTKRRTFFLRPSASPDSKFLLSLCRQETIDCRPQLSPFLDLPCHPSWWPSCPWISPALRNLIIHISYNHFQLQLEKPTWFLTACDRKSSPSLVLQGSHLTIPSCAVCPVEPINPISLTHRPNAVPLSTQSL